MSSTINPSPQIAVVITTCFARWTLKFEKYFVEFGHKMISKLVLFTKNLAGLQNIAMIAWNLSLWIFLKDKYIHCNSLALTWKIYSHSRAKGLHPLFFDTLNLSTRSLTIKIYRRSFKNMAMVGRSFDTHDAQILSDYMWQKAPTDISVTANPQSCTSIILMKILRCQGINES